jgi:hypothetical protein
MLIAADVDSQVHLASAADAACRDAAAVALRLLLLLLLVHSSWCLRDAILLFTKCCLARDCGSSSVSPCNFSSKPQPRYDET